MKNDMTPPNGEKRILLHCCCAPCTGGIIESVLAAGIDLTLFFYNPNIHPKSEYERRKGEIVRFAGKKNIPVVDADYDPDTWFKRVEGLEMEPERGKRCSACFDMRLERAALFASENGFKVFTSSFGISRWKDMHQVSASGMNAASRHPGLVYWTYNWREKGGQQLKHDVAKREQFYQQKYCGCVYSKRDADRRSQRSSPPPILTSKS